MIAATGSGTTHEQAGSTMTDQGLSDTTTTSASLNWPLLLILLPIPFEWLLVPALGYRSIMWLPVLFAVCSLVISPIRAVQRMENFFSIALKVNIFYLCYMGALTCATLWGANVGDGVAELVRAYSQLFFYVVIGTVLVGRSLNSNARTILIAVPLSLLAFVCYCQYVFMVRGDSLTAQLMAAVSSGDSNAVAQRVIRHIVGFQFAESSPERALEVCASVRNSISSSLLVSLLLFWALTTTLPKSQKGFWFGSSMVFVSTMVPVLLFIIMSRSNLIACLAAPLIAYAFYMFSSTGLRSRNTIVFAALVAVQVVIAAILLYAGFSDNEFLALNIQRMQDISSDVRLQHYHEIFDRIQQRPWLGYGLGAETPDGRKVHNLFLGGWFRAGIPGLVLSVLFYIALAFVWVRESFSIHRQSGVVKEFPTVFWIPALMVEPLLRTPLIGGQGGRFLRVEWLAVACFLTVCATLRQTTSRTTSLH